jgi:type VI secretion system secreted protein VgrG
VADDGSYIRIGGGVEIGTQGKAIVHAGEHDWVGPKTDSAAIPIFGRDGADQRHRLHYEGDPAAIAQGQPYKVVLEDSSLVQGVTGIDGLTELLQRADMQFAGLEVFRNESPQTANPGSSSKGTNANSDGN